MVAYILIVVVAFFGLRVLKLAGQSPNENSSKTSDSSPVVENGSVGPTWVGQEVIIEGNLTGPFCLIPEGAPPYDYELCTNEGIIGVRLPSDNPVYDSTCVRVYGVIKEGMLAGGISEYWNGNAYVTGSVQFVEAERIELIP